MAPITLLQAPAGARKTETLIATARVAAQQGQRVHVCVATALQQQAWQRRVAAAGGALGVAVWTFDQLVGQIVRQTQQTTVPIADAVRYRLLRHIISTTPLTYYAALKEKPGFAQLIQRAIAEFKAGDISPRTFQHAVAAAFPTNRRLAEIGQLFAAYEAALTMHGWSDQHGRQQLATHSLNDAATSRLAWPLLIIDGFDSFTATQRALLAALTKHVDSIIVSLTKPDAAVAGFYPRFDRTYKALVRSVDVGKAEAPAGSPHPQYPLHSFANQLYRQGYRASSPPPLIMYAVPTIVDECREALRWLRQQLIDHNLQLHEVALLARDLTTYQPFIQQVANEFGLPIQMVKGESLRQNPAIHAIGDLLRALLPDHDSGELSLPRQLLLRVWRSPYFNWHNVPNDSNDIQIGITPRDADLLDAVARSQRVNGNLALWRYALQTLSQLPQLENEDAESETAESLPEQTATTILSERFERFIQAVMPPQEAVTFAEYVAWLQQLLGLTPSDTQTAGRYSLMMNTTVTASPRHAQRDVAALNAFNHILHGLLWSEEALGLGQQVTFSRFVTELQGAIDAATYMSDEPAGSAHILVADVIQARGLTFKAVAVMGLAESSFPATISEDPFLRDHERDVLKKAGLEIELSALSDERTFLYNSLSRATDQLLLTRPRIADNGAEWLASPYWEQVVKQSGIQPIIFSTEHRPSPSQAASLVELLESLTTQPALATQQPLPPDAAAALEQVAYTGSLLAARTRSDTSPFNGDLSDNTSWFADKFGPDTQWSASRLESYQTCPFYFFTARVLRLEPRSEPDDSIGPRQLGNIYHRIFELVYRDERLAALPTEAYEALVEEIALPVLDRAPAKEGFRETAWWQQTRREIIGNVVASVAYFKEEMGGYRPVQLEAYFGGETALLIQRGDDSFKLRGLIDRIDQDEEGRIRIIDYKLGGPSTFNKRALSDGKKLQLPLYGMAAEALGAGTIADGFYWHVRHISPSGLTLANFEEGPADARSIALEFAWHSVDGVRAAQFKPQPPANGCPSYCPATSFCHHYQPGRSG